MRKFLWLSLLAMGLQLNAQQPTTPFEQSNGTETPVYPVIIKWWQMMDQRYPQIKMLTMGPTDAGFPLHLIIVSNNRDFDFNHLRQQNKRIILINNGIHPGEPDGIDASMLLVRDIMIHKIKLPDNIVLAIIPVYNIGGCLDRSEFYRVDQNGPKAFGFRGNAQNLDLNRDFIKSDSKNARSFAEIFHLCDPDVFVDNHVSDGADYQHVMTLLTTQHNKLGGAMGDYLNKEFDPAICKLMKEKGYDLVPYVNFYGETPEVGWSEYFDSPRYSTGYTSLWNTFGFMPETHMLKPYQQRVESTYALMQCFIEFTSKNSETIKKLRNETIAAEKHHDTFPINWKLDRSRYSEIDFKGYKAGHKTSEVSGLPRLYYDRSQPFDKKIKFYNYYDTSQMVTRPEAYIIPQGWWKVIDLLKINKVKMQRLGSDTTIEVEVYHIKSYQSLPHPYEAHHLNSHVEITTSTEKQAFRKGDYYIPINQVANRFLVETLEPQAIDSYFAWNFFDAILGQKEGISDYVFEETAAQYLKDHPEMRQELEQKKAADSAFAQSGRAQLNYVFEHSPYFEPAYLRYPVYRVMK